jgi:anti-sigma B factor antagonist
MDLHILNNQVGDVSVVALKGRIVLGDGSSALRERVKSLVGDGKKKIVPNMTNVTYIDSAGLGALVAAHVSAKKEGAVLVLSDLGTKFHEVVQITRLLTVFSVFAIEAEAINSFGETSRAAGAYTVHLGRLGRSFYDLRRNVTPRLKFRGGLLFGLFNLAPSSVFASHEYMLASISIWPALSN